MQRQINPNKNLFIFTFFTQHFSETSYRGLHPGRSVYYTVHRYQSSEFHTLLGKTAQLKVGQAELLPMARNVQLRTMWDWPELFFQYSRLPAYKWTGNLLTIEPHQSSILQLRHNEKNETVEKREHEECLSSRNLSLAIGVLKGTQAWEIFCLWFWILYYFIVS